MFCICYRDLFQAQRLLLGGDDVDIIQSIVRRPHILPRGIRPSPDGVLRWEDDGVVDDDSVQLVVDGGEASLLQSVVVLSTAVVVCGFGMRFCRRRTRQHRKHILTSEARRSFVR